MRQIDIDGWRIFASDTNVTLQDPQQQVVGSWTLNGTVTLHTTGQIPFDVFTHTVQACEWVKRRANLLELDQYNAGYARTVEVVFEKCLGGTNGIYALVVSVDRGEFETELWNICVDKGKTHDNIPTVGLYIMGNGSGQCNSSFHWLASDLTIDELESWAQRVFNTRIIRGVV